MFKQKKKAILELFDTIVEMTNTFNELTNIEEKIQDCIMAFNIIIQQFDNEEDDVEKIKSSIKDIRTEYNSVLNNYDSLNDNFIESNIYIIRLIQKDIKEKIKGKLKIVFMPYKASMWDSLETIYLSALIDEDCEAKVVPIPYYKLEQDKAILTYEGDEFPKNIEVTHFSEYVIEREKPDIIFVHNIYDNYNNLTQVKEEYFTGNLKKHTDMLVYVPYHISSPYNTEKGGMRYAYNIPTISNVDKVILAGKFVEKEALRDGISKNKILTLGSPKFDGIYNEMHNDTEIQEEWESVIEGKKVVLLNTECMFLPNNGYDSFIVLDLIFDMARYLDNIALIWRPHPLSRDSIKRFTPELLGKYDSYCDSIRKRMPYSRNIILDESSNYYPALKVSDLLISGISSILNSYLITEKPILFMGDKLPGKPIVPRNAFYYFWDEYEPWCDFIKKFSRGEDRLEENRKGILKKIYENVDGTCGEKVWKEIKICALEK